MTYREVEMIEVKEVLRRWRAGEAKKAIARAKRVFLIGAGPGARVSHE